MPIAVNAVDLDLDMHAVVDQQDRGRGCGFATVAGELRARFQRGGVAALQLDRELPGNDAVGGDIGVAAGRQRRGGIQKGLRFRDHLGAAGLVKTPAAFAGLVRYRVGAVERVVQAAPARVGGVQRIAGVGERHHQLRPADLADLLVDIGRLDLLGRRLRQQIADLLEKRRIGIHVERLALVGAVPAVDFRLQGVAHREQFAVLRRQVLDDGRKPCPEGVGRNPGLGGRFLGDEIEQNGGDLQSVGVDTIHDGIFSREKPRPGAVFRGTNDKRAPQRALFGALLALKPGP